MTHDATPLCYPPGTILTTEQVAQWLQCSTRTVESMPLPKLRGLGPRLVRYEASAVLDYLKGDRAA
jgi:predicted DNA-binding transcriptional regulator AlpA